ncbi:quinol:cytochrome c oxidoreductase pentaheme cytochrome subunit [Roseomonas rosea]|uniref:Quinol:cytochrome c oxidoreductase pentaheme cytochrome subunit n=1 Tax=Muricoccus roseus TaxID=198092 RepID=A0A1M6C9B0_9PROT|nr:cytochrome c3 family protein [Roseomonas rosea]SHI57589.1 quinol:cytochrome c oxidoreductase pentaheme cytochrome subunit [Roseomonas rosea]
MAQIFTPRADARLRLALIVGAALILLIGAGAFAWVRSGTAWAVGKPADQPIPFSHAVHAGGLGLDCRFCHAGVERAADAGMPSAETCLGCHERVWNVTAQFAPLRAALELGRAVEWSSVSRLPDHVRFDHAAHTQAGVACESCHGKVQEMPRTAKAETLSMSFCLDCHRDPSPRQRPAAAVMARGDAGAGGPRDLRPHGLQVQRYEHYGVEVSPLTRCSTCHR